MTSGAGKARSRLPAKKCTKWRRREAKTDETIAQAARNMPAKQGKTTDDSVRSVKRGLAFLTDVHITTAIEDLGHEFSSGKHTGKRKISKCGRANVRYALCVAATRMTSKNGIYHDVAEQMRAEGKKFGEIRVAVARKLLRVLHAVVLRDQDFDLRRFVARRGTGDDPKVHQDRRAA